MSSISNEYSVDPILQRGESHGPTWRRLIPSLNAENPVTVLCALLLVWLATNLLIPQLLPGGSNLYLAQPLLWLAVALVARRSLPASSFSRATLVLALLAGAFHVACLGLAGLLYGFGESTYSHTPVAIAANLWFLACYLTGFEHARAALLRFASLRSAAGFAVVVLLFAALNLPFAQWQGMLTNDGALITTGSSRLLPSAAASLVATLFALAGGPWAAIAYRGVVLATEWLSPVLPDLTWIETALAGTLAPAIAFMLARPALFPEASHEALPTEKLRAVPGWLIAFGLAVLAGVWLNTGLLGVKPAIVSGVSMEPALVLGDIVVTRPVDTASLTTGDVIRFRSGAVPVLHRIKDVRQTRDGLVFVTQGDNNDFEDAPVPASAVEGKVVLTVPKLGLAPITVKEWLTR